MKDNQAKYPQLRFKGFTDSWEQRKLGEVATFLNGRAYKQDELLDSGKYKVLRVGNFYTNDSWYYSNMELGDKYYVDKGDLVYTWSATFGPHIWSGEKVIYHYHIWKVELSKFLDRNFTLQLLEADKARLLSSTNGSTMIHVTKGDMESKIVSIPNIDEQKQIGSFFKQLDNTITLHQRKLAKLKELKQGYLQKLFPKNGSKFPQLRFAGFADAWEQRKLGELFKPSRNKNNNDLYNQKDILAASLGTELIPKRTFFGLKSTKESVKNYRVVKHGDLIYTKSPIKGFPNGIVRTNKGNVGIVPSLYCVYQAQKEINTSIIQLYFEDKNRLDFYLFPLVNVGARNNVNITDLEFLEGIIKVPKSIEEQKKIVDFIEHFNKAITLHQRKLEKLQELKKGYLQKMFC
ncbi:restriction endonuclease subunit S [Bifidobacterium longum]|uniref:Restriction endonuclease subunit S n=1 Tax=Bifidobacterium longum TaxID=216816 RepID=A0A6B1XGC5_BIFLN|nr:restriction endonuclease subunit S [Bifidobacterium longum]